MALHLHETDSGWIVSYTIGNANWDQPGVAWLAVDEARARYEARKPMMIRESSENDGERLLRCRWELGTNLHDFVGVQFFNRSQSVVADVSYQSPDGKRLMVTQRFDYTYPDDERWYGQHQSAVMGSAYYEPDGRGVFELKYRESGEVLRTRFKDADFSSLWVEWPEFGDWDRFANFETGTLRPDFKMTPL